MDGKFCRFSVDFQFHPIIAQIFKTHRDWAVGRLHQGRFAKENGIDLHSGLNCHRRFGGGMLGSEIQNLKFQMAKLARAAAGIQRSVFDVGSSAFSASET